jgi:hypothetical protein
VKQIPLNLQNSEHFRVTLLIHNENPSLLMSFPEN